MAQEEHVEFTANSRTTIHVGGSGMPYRPGTAVHLPKSHAEEIDHLHARHETAAQEKARAEAAKAERRQARADAPKDTPAAA